MKTKQFIRALPLLVLTIAVIGVPFLLANLFFASVTIGNIAMANGGLVGGTVTTDKVEAIQPDLNMAEVADKITKMRPSATPIATIFASHATKKSVRSQRTEYYSVDIKPFTDAVRTAYSHAGDGQALANIAVEDIALFDVDDTVMFKGITGSDGKPFVGAIAARDVANRTISIQPLNGPKGTGTMAQKEIVPKSIVVGTKLIRMGVAKSELDAQTSPFSIMPSKDYNFTQNFMAQVEESVFQRLTKTEVAWGFTDYEELNVYDMKARQELSYLFGVRKQFVDAVDNEQKYTCGGLTRYMTKTQEYTAASGLTNNSWVDWTKYFFADNAGSDNRFMFAGDDLIAVISKIDGVQKQLDAKNVEVKWGINFNVIETKFGVLYVKRHPLFGIIGLGGDGVVLDVNNLEEHEFVPLQFTTLDLKKSGQRNANATVLQKVACPVLKYPGTHAYIKAI